MIGSGCTPNQRIVDSSSEAAKSTPINDAADEPSTVSVDADIASMRTADFNFIYVFRRKDGGVLAPDDKIFINENTPYEINRKKLSDGGRALVVGSNFRYPPENFKAMVERFKFEDFSKPESEILEANSNAIK